MTQSTCPRHYYLLPAERCASSIAAYQDAKQRAMTRIARGEIRRLIWGLAVALLDLHERECRALHTLERIGED